jgi:hypothetical protein
MSQSAFTAKSQRNTAKSQNVSTARNQGKNIAMSLNIAKSQRNTAKSQNVSIAKSQNTSIARNQSANTSKSQGTSISESQNMNVANSQNVIPLNLNTFTFKNHHVNNLNINVSKSQAADVVNLGTNALLSSQSTNALRIHATNVLRNPNVNSQSTSFSLNTNLAFIKNLSTKSLMQ